MKPPEDARASETLASDTGQRLGQLLIDMIVCWHDRTLFQVHVHEHHRLGRNQAVADEGRQRFQTNIVPGLVSDVRHGNRGLGG